MKRDEAKVIFTMCESTRDWRDSFKDAAWIEALTSHANRQQSINIFCMVFRFEFLSSSKILLDWSDDVPIPPHIPTTSHVSFHFPRKKPSCKWRAY